MLLLTFAGSAIQLVPDGTLLIHLAIIVVMVAVLNATLLKPINRVLVERKGRTRGRFTEAEAILNKMAQRLREYEAQLRDARAEGYKVLERERLALAREREQKVGEVKAEVTRWSDETKDQLGTDAQKIKASLKRDAVRMAQQISRRILGREIRVAELPHNE